MADILPLAQREVLQFPAEVTVLSWFATLSHPLQPLLHRAGHGGDLSSQSCVSSSSSAGHKVETDLGNCNK